jgi:hypothetical protein
MPAHTGFEFAAVPKDLGVIAFVYFAWFAVYIFGPSRKPLFPQIL